MAKLIPEIGDHLIADIPGTYGERHWSASDRRWVLYPTGEHLYKIENVLPEANYIRTNYGFMNMHIIEWLDKEQIWVLKYPIKWVNHDM